MDAIMTFKTLLFSCALVLASAVSTSAATISLGDATGGLSTTQRLKVQQLDFINFSLAAPKGSFVSALDISVTSRAGSNLREMIALYSGGVLVASSDSGVGRGGGTATLSFSGDTALADGNYTLAIGGWRSFFTPDIATARTTAFFNNGSYSVSIAPTLAAVPAVPLPAAGLLLLSGLGVFAVARRRAGKTLA